MFINFPENRAVKKKCGKTWHSQTGHR